MTRLIGQDYEVINPAHRGSTVLPSQEPLDFLDADSTFTLWEGTSHKATD